MAQLSRTYQIALGAVLLLGLALVVAMRVHGSNPSEPAPASVPAPKVAKGTVAAHTSAHHTAAVGRTTAHRTALRTHRTALRTHTTVRSHTKATVAHGTTVHSHATVAVSRKTASHTTKTVVVVHRTVSSSHHTVVRSSAHAGSPSGGRTGSRASGHGKRPPEQAAVEHELAEGRTVMLVFWNPHTPVDREVHAQAGALASGSKGTVVVHSALANQVGMFGSITEVVHVYQTPTILIVNRHGVVSTLTGLTDVFALQQAVREAQSATR